MTRIEIDTPNEYGLDWIAQEQDRLTRSASWAHIQDLHDNAIEGITEFNTALKEYRDAYPRKE